MTELRDRLAAVLYDALHATGFDYGETADRLIAAGVTMPAPTCGAEVVICGNEFVCDQPDNGHRVHECSDSVGIMRWRDTKHGPVVVSAEAHPDGAGWAIQ